MPQTARKPATWEDLLLTPDDGRVWEVLSGELEAQPRPRPPHNLAQARLAGQLSGPFDLGGGQGPGGWWILIEPDVRLATSEIVVPDLAGWRRERMPELPETRPIDLAPDWVVEVVSPSDRGRDRIRKASLYLATSVPFYWILDPEERTLEAFIIREDAWLRLGGWTDGDTPRIAPFDAVETDVASLFPPRRASVG